MEHSTNIDERAGESQRPDKLYVETNLLRIAGALFCHDQRVARTRTSQITLNQGAIEKQISIRPDPSLGQPGPLAHKVFVALIKKHSDYGKPIRNDIHFTRREIGRLIGRKDWGGRDSEQLSRALHEIHYTFVKTHFKQVGGRFVEHSFAIFPQILIERREFASDPIEACTITLADPIIQSLQDEHFTCLNHRLMQTLGTIGQALYMRCFFHFANLYTGGNRTRLVFQKRYEDVCAEWLGGLKVLTYKSDIARDQLGPHLQQLVASKFFDSFDITKAKGGDGFVLTFKPGKTFFDDYDRFYRGRAQGELQWEFHTDQRKIGEPLKLAYEFAERRTGQPVTSIAYVSSKDVETAKQLLTEITIEDAPAFLDFGLAQAAKTKFDVQSLGGLRQYLAPFKARQAAKAVSDKWDAEDRHREGTRLAYNDYRRKRLLHLFHELPSHDQCEIERLAQAKAAKLGISPDGPMFNATKLQVLSQHFSEQVESFEEWQTAA